MPSLGHSHFCLLFRQPETPAPKQSCEKHGDGFLTRKAQTEKSAPIRQFRSGFGVFGLPANEEQKMRISHGWQSLRIQPAGTEGAEERVSRRSRGFRDFGHAASRRESLYELRRSELAKAAADWACVQKTETQRSGNPSSGSFVPSECQCFISHLRSVPHIF